MTDSEIIRRILNGERDAFRFLVQRYQPMIFRIAVGFLHSREDADDLTQDIFIQVYHSLTKFRGDSSFHTWLYRTALNAALNRTRRNKRNIFQRMGDFLGNERQHEKIMRMPDEEDPENTLIKEEHRVLVRKALDDLPVNQRSAIILSKYDELSQSEIAQILGITEGAVEALIQRAKANLRKKLSILNKKNK